MYQISHTQHQLLSMYSRLLVCAAIRAEHVAVNLKECHPHCVYYNLIPPPIYTHILKSFVNEISSPFYSH